MQRLKENTERLLEDSQYQAKSKTQAKIEAQTKKNEEIKDVLKLGAPNRGTGPVC
jgi:hypothetical protein